MNRFLILNPKDNVAVALSELTAGEKIEFTVENMSSSISLVDDIQFGHKFALASLKAGDEIIKYGHVIGLATESVEAGQHIHVHNVESIRARGDK